MHNSDIVQNFSLSFETVRISNFFHKWSNKVSLTPPSVAKFLDAVDEMQTKDI